MAPLEILITGCGIAGSTLASFLLLNERLPATEKPHITVVERSATIQPEGQNIDIRGAGLTIVRKLGLESEIRAAHTGEEGVQFVDEKNRVWASFAADKTGKTSTPTADIEILRGTLAEICYRKSKSISDSVQEEGGKGVDYVFGDYLDEIDQDGDQVRVRFAKSGARRSFDLLVGADGLQSRTRKMVWGAAADESRMKRLGMYQGFFSIPTTDTDSSWRRWFRTAGRRGIMLRPSSQPGKTTVLMGVVSEQDDRLIKVGERGMQNKQAQKDLLKEYFQDAGWECPRIIDGMMATDDFYYDTVTQIKMDRWSKGRVVLLGDAGYCASPISGMGTTLALNGAYNLAGALAHHPRDHAAALDDYEAKMRPVVERAQKLAPGMPHSLHPETAWGVWFLNSIAFLFWSSGVLPLLARVFGPPANAVPVEDFGFRELAE